MSAPSDKLLGYIKSVYGDCDNDRQNVPYSLYVAAPGFFKRCMEENDTDVRHLGRFLWFGISAKSAGPDSFFSRPTTRIAERAANGLAMNAVELCTCVIRNLYWGRQRNARPR